MDKVELYGEGLKVPGGGINGLENTILRSLNTLSKTIEEKESDSLRDCLTLEEIERVKTVEHLISALLDTNWEYGKIRNFVLNEYFIPTKEEDAQNGIKEHTES